jgi:2',3'-cyclic-nucleotide 2'-phosphodiesterase (5'-nucleotidase family)
LYYQAGLEKWGDEYDIVLGGGFISARSPYNLYAGEVKYGDLQMIFPFNNQLVLCSISGRKLRDQFFETENSNYYIAYGSYGESVRKNIDLNATYYIIIDTYSSQYAPNGCTEIARYDETTFARDLLAAYVKKGGLA